MASHAIAQIILALAFPDKRKVLGVHDAHIEGVRVLGIALERILRDQRANDLLVIGLDEDGRFHAASSHSRQGKLS